MVVFQSSKNWALSLSLVAAGVLVSESAQAVGLLTPPPPDTIVSFSNIQMQGAGVNLNLFPAGSPEVLNLLGGGVAGFCDGGGATGECAYFDFRPPNGLPNGEVFFADADPFPGGVFDNVIGDTGTVRDVLLPFLGVINDPNLNLAVDIPALIDANPDDGSTAVDTFDATSLAGVAIQPIGSGSFVSFNFDGVWNIMNPDGTIGEYEGTVTFSQALSEPIEAVLAAARQPEGFFTTLSGQANVEGDQGVPEPSAMAGLAVVAGLVFMQRSRAKR